MPFVAICLAFLEISSYVCGIAGQSAQLALTMGAKESKDADASASVCAMCSMSELEEQSTIRI